LEDKEQETKAKDQQFEESKEQVIDTGIVCVDFYLHHVHLKLIGQ